MSTTVGLPGPPATEDVPASSPGPRRLRLVPAPDWDPPIEGADGSAAGHLRVVPDSIGKPRVVTQDELALDYQLPSGLPAVPEPPALRLITPLHNVGGPGSASGIVEPWTLDDDEPGPALTGRDELPDPRRWAARLAQGVLEVAAGARPTSQLWRWTTQEVLDDVRRRSRPATVLDSQRRRAQVPALVRSVHVCEPADGVAEATAIVQGRLRTRALALRLEGLDGRWLCTALEWV